MPAFSDQQLLHFLIIKDEVAYELLYKISFPSFRKYILKNSGTIPDAEDVFQDALVVLFHKIQDPSFKLFASFQTYLMAIGKNIWLKKLRRQTVSLESENWDTFFEPSHISYELVEEKTLGEKLDELLARATFPCQQLLRVLFYTDTAMTMLGYKNKHTADNQKYKCLQQVRKSANKDLA